MRERVSLLELAEDFGLAKHHRIEAACNFEQMMQALRFGERVNFVAKVGRDGALRRPVIAAR